MSDSMRGEIVLNLRILLLTHCVTDPMSYADLEFEWDDAKARRQKGPAMSDDAPKMSRAEIARSVDGRVMMRLKRGDFRQGSDIAILRKYLGMTQEQFALALSISVSTLRGWERDARMPVGPAVTLLSIAASHPRIIRQRLKEAQAA